MNNFLWNMFANIQNGHLIRRPFIIQKRKKACEAVLNVLWDEGFILGYKIITPEKKKLKIFLKYTNNKAVIQTIKSVSKPGSRIYYSIKQLWKIDSSKIFLIISTNRGVKTLIDCKKLQIGGEPVLVIK